MSPKKKAAKKKAVKKKQSSIKAEVKANKSTSVATQSKKEGAKRKKQNKTNTRNTASEVKNTSVSQSVKAAPVMASAEKPSAGRGLSWLALLCSLLALAAAGYAAWQTTLGGQVVGAKVTSFDDRLKLVVADQQGIKSSMTDLSSKTAELGKIATNDVGRISDGLANVESKFEKVQAASQTSIDEVKANLGQSVARWQLDEVHSLLGRVNQSYLITGDKNQAINGFKLAQASLSTIDNPKLAAVRSALAEDILQLKASKMVDVAALNDRLAGVSKLIPSLSLMEDKYAQIKQDMQPAKAETDNSEANKSGGIASFGKSLLSDLGSLVKHKNLDAPLKPSMDASSKFALYESLQLNIQAAAVSLLRRNNTVYQSQLEQAGETFNAYFDTQEGSAKTVLSELQLLADEDVSLNVDSVSKAIEALSQVMSLDD